MLAVLFAKVRPALASAFVLPVAATAVLAGCGAVGGVPAGAGTDVGATSSPPPATAVLDGGGRSSTAPPGATTSNDSTTVSGAGGSAGADGDVDGDGLPDELTLSDGGVLTVRYAAGGGDEVVLGQGAPGDQELLGTADANGDGRAEVFVRVTMGANAQIVTVLRQVDDQLVRMTLDDQPSSLSSGGGGYNQFAWACEPEAGEPGAGTIVTWFASSEDGGQTLEGEVRRYVFAGSALVVTYQEPFSIAADDAVPGVSVRPGCGSILR